MLKNFLKEKINDFIYILSVFLISYFLINIYKFNNNESLGKSDPGFRSASAINASKDLCVISIQNMDCQKNLFSKLKKNKKSILFLGNSQMGAINEFESGDLSFISLLSKDFKSKKSDFLIKGLWLPNANMKEFEFINQTLNRCSISAELLIIPVFLDDTRINNIRNELDDYHNLLCQKQKSSSIKVSNNLSNIQKMNQNIKKRFKIFEDLKYINERFRIDIYKFRNYLFNIQPTSVRNIRKPIYYENINALKNIVNSRDKQKLKTIVYIPPLLNSVNGGLIPYKRKDYINFKKEISTICDSQKCIYFNFENEVPTDLWGLKKSTNLNKNKMELDFMHFTGKGHKALADKFSVIIEKYYQIN